MRVLANGCFDVFHYGHLLHLKAAKEMGDWLIVSVTSDKFVNKAGRPIHTELQRAAIVKEQRCVDEVLIVDTLTEALDRTKPVILVKGIDYKDSIHPAHFAYCKARGIEIRFTDTPKYSTTEILNELKRRSGV